MKKPLKDVAASVRQKLYNRAKETNRPFNELLQYYAMERFLYRLSKSEHRDKFVLKGALMFIVWKAPRARATMDIDFLGRVKNSIDKLVAVVRDVCQVPVEPDGVFFHPQSVRGERIKENADYEGGRLLFKGNLGQAKVSMQIDVAFGDKVTPAPAMVDYPVILDLPVPHLKGYPPETVVAEKFEAMVKLGAVNSRMKDFYDLWLLAEQFSFDGEALAKALKGTFANRKTEMTMEPVALTPKFAAEKKAQWAAFLRKTGLKHAPNDIGDAIRSIRELVLPVVDASMAGRPFRLRRQALGPWR